MANSVLGPMGAMRPATSDPAQQDIKVQGPPEVVRLSREFQIPRNVLMALEEGGEDLAQAAPKISEAMKGGQAIEDVVPYAALVRAGDIADQIEGIEPEGGIGKAFSAGIDNLQSAYGSALEGVGRSTGIDGLESMGARIAENNAAEARSNSRGLTSMRDVDGLGSGASYATETVAQQVPQLGSSLGPIAAGAAIGSVVPGLGTGAGAAAGGFLALAQNLAQFYGFNRERQKEVNDGEVDEATAFAAAIPQAGTDLLSDVLVAAPIAKPFQAASIASRIMKGAALGAASEAPTEVAQQAIERAQAGLPVTGEDARGEYLESAVAGGLVGGVLGGGAGSFRSRRDSEEPVSDPLEENSLHAIGRDAEPLALPSPTRGGTIMVGPDGEAHAGNPEPGRERDLIDDGSVDEQGADGGVLPPDGVEPSAPAEIAPREIPRSEISDLAAEALDNRAPPRTDDPASDFSSLSLADAKARLVSMRSRARHMHHPSKNLLATIERLAEVVEDKETGADTVFEPIADDPEPIKPVPPSSGASIEPVRKRAAVLRGVPKAEPLEVQGVSLKWDDKENGFVFSRKHQDRVQAALDAREAAPVATAAKQTAKDPTPAQAEAENYKTGKVSWRGLKLSIENERGSVRSKKTPDGKTEWSVTMPAHYGRLLGTIGADGDHVDFYMGQDEGSEAVFVVDQIDAGTKKFDELKVILGVGSVNEARTLYEKGFSDGKGSDRLGAITETTIEGLKEHLRDGDPSVPFARATGNARDVQSPALSNLAERDGSVHESQEPILSQLRRKGDQDSSKVDAVHGISDSGGGAPNGQASAGPKRQRRQLRAGEPSLGHQEAERAQHAEKQDGDSSRRNADHSGVGRASKSGTVNDLVPDRQGDESGTGSNNASPDERKGVNHKGVGDGLLSSLSAEKQDRAAELKAKLAAKVRNQASSGLDPEYITLGGELVALYIEGGVRKFGQMLKDFAETTELSLREAQEPMRAAYNHVRDNMDLAGDDISGMDDASAVLSEVRAILAEQSEPSPSEGEGAIVPPEPANEASDEHHSDRKDTPDDLSGVEGSEPRRSTDAQGRRSGDERGDGGSGKGGRNESESGNDLAGSLERDRSGDPRGQAAERKGVSPGNFTIPNELTLGAGTPGEKIKANLEAIHLLKDLQGKNRFATTAEQETLARYVGWGGLKRVFDPREAGKSTQWGRAQGELKDLLTPDQFRAAAYSTAHAHFTSKDVVTAMWDAMRGFGFEGGRALEPTVGTGNFLGLQPQDLAAGTEWFAAELDDLTGAMAEHIYPDATIFAGKGFEDAPFRPGTIDVAIGNPPFGSETLKSKLHPEIPAMSVHNYIIAKTGVLLRPGGIMGLVVTNRFLDTPNPQARSYLNEHFNFMGAVRLPNTAFKANAGTDVTTDVVWFQKRRDGEKPGDQSWLETGVERDGVKMNGYFASNPDMMLGTPSMEGTMYGPDPEFTLHDDGRDLPSAMREAFSTIQGSLSERTEQLQDAVVQETLTSDLAIGEALLDGDGRVMMRMDDDTAGNAVVEEITEQSPWGPIAKELVAAREAIASAREAIKGEAAEEAKVAVDTAIIAIAETNALSSDGSLKKSPPTGMGKQAHGALGVILDGLGAESPSFGPKQNKALRNLREAIKVKTIGKQRFDALKGMLALRRDTVALLAAEMRNDPKMETKRKALRRSYRAFVKQHGYVNDPGNDSLVGNLPGAEAALEASYKKANKKEGIAAVAKEAAILSERINKPYQRATKADSPADGIHVSMRERGKLDMGLISDLTGKDLSDVVSDLTGGDKPLAFYDPALKEYVIADDYLSGNLAEKIREARELGAQENLRHLEAALPKPKNADQITPSIRSMWMPPEVFSAFLAELGATSPKVTVNMKAATFDVQANGELSDFGQMFQTERMSPFQIFAFAAKGKSIVVFDRDANGKQHKNEKATQDANAAAERMGAEFEKWAYLNPERKAAIVDAFNEKMNVVVPQKFDGVSYLTQVGNNPQIELRNSQKNGAWRMIRSDSALLHHVVGAGKTFTAITAIMERKRLGLSQKPMVTVPNHLVAQWARDFHALYPGANVLAATEKDFQLANRRKLLARIATGNFDAVIIGHSALRYIENSRDDTESLLKEQLGDLQEALDEAKRSGASRATVSQSAARVKKYEEKMKKILEKLEGDKLGFDFAEMGIDYLVVDEAHEFKNLEYATSSDRLVGMNSPDGSQRAFDLYIKTRGMRERDGALGFLTGTPVSNSLVEIYTIMKYMIPETLRNMGLLHYDSWASSFVQSKIRFEYTAAQKLKERNVLAGLNNLGPLSDLYQSFADIVMRPDVERMYREQKEDENKRNGTNLPTRFPTPKVKSGGRRLVSLPSSPAQDEFTDYLVMRMSGIQANKSNKDYAKTDNALWVLSDARKASIDIRTVDPEGQRHEASKVVASGNNILRKAKEFEKARGTQLVFADSSVPAKNASKDIKIALRQAWSKAGLSPSDTKNRIARDEAQEKPWSQQWGEAIEAIDQRLSAGDVTSAQQESIETWMNGDAASDGAAAAFTADAGFSFYDDLKAYLVEQGMKAEEIAFIHDYATSDAKTGLFEAVNEGRIRVLIGSTFKMGAGTNAQERLVALHHIDAPWRPSDMEQREGRIIRQGNKLYDADPEGFEVEITAYTTEKTSDVVLWQVLERKAAGIEQFLNSSADKLVDEDGSDADSYAEFMAQSTGNPIFLRKMETEKAVRDMESEQASIRMVVSEAKSFMDTYDRRLADERKFLDAFEGVSFDSYPDAGGSYQKYKGAVRAYDAAKAKHEVDSLKVRSANAKLPDGAKPEPLPKFEQSPPSLFSGKLDPYTARVKAAIEEARDTGMSGPIKVGTAELRIRRKDTNSEGVFAYDVRISVEGLGDAGGIMRSPAIVKNPFNSRTLTGALSPEGVLDYARYSAGKAVRSLERMEAARPEMEKKAAISIDTKALNQQKRDLQMYKGLVRVAEVTQAQDRLGRVNRFAAMDQKGRDLALKTSDDAPLLPEDEGGDFTFTSDGTTYTAQIGAKDGVISARKGPQTELYWFNARDSDGSPALLQVGRSHPVAEKEGEDRPPAVMEVLDVFDTSKALEPAKEARMLPGAEPEPGMTSESLRGIARSLSAEMARTGLKGKVPVRLVRNLISTANGESIQGRFSSPGGIEVSAATGSEAKGVLRHEIIHALRSEALWGEPYGLFTSAEWRSMVRAARGHDDIAKQVRENYGDQPAPVQAEEMVAELYRRWAGQREKAGAAEKAFAKIRDFLTALANALGGHGFQSSGMTMERIASGIVAGREGAAASGSSAPLEVREMRALPGTIPAKFKGLVGSGHWKDPRGFISNKISDAMTGNGDYSLLALVPGRPLFKEMGKRLISAGSYLKHKENMDQARNDWHARADKVSQAWLELRRKDARSNDTFMDLLHRTTLAQIDPTKPYDGSDATLAKKEVGRKGRRAPEWAHQKVAQDKASQKAHAVLSRIFRSLPAEFQNLYSQVAGEYGKMADDFEDAIVENVKNSMRIALKRAKKEHARAMQQIKDDGLEGKERAEAISEADEALRIAQRRNGKGAASKVQSLREQFESNRLSGPYFPLARFGQYFVTMRDANGQVTSFSKFESEAEQKEHIARMKKENPTSKITHGVATQKGLIRDQVNPTFVADVEHLLADAEVSDELLDSIWQKWLETMPDQSIRTSRIHRKGRAGWNRDAFRAFGRHMFHGAHQLARLRHGVLLEESLDDAREEAARADNPNRAGALVNEMERRHEFTMNPQGSSAVASLSSLAFLWYLGATPAAAMVNLSQTTIVGTPIMATRFSKAGVTGSLKALSDAAMDFGRGKGMIEQSSRLNADEKAAMREAYRRGTVDKTQAHDLASVAETGIEYNAFREKWMRRIGWMFHHAERANREVTFLANYRLAKQEGLSSSEAVDLAADLTWKIHFDYQNTSRPRFMQSDIGKILTTFRQFTVNMLYRMFRDAHQALHGATQAERREARGQLVGITLSMMAHAGIKGTWGYGLIMSLLALFTPGDADDLEDWLQSSLLMEGDDPGSAAWNFAMGAALNGAPGHIMGTNLTERIGMPNFWFRGPGRELEGRDLYAHYVSEVLGPVFGIGEGFVRGAFAVADGEVMRGAEAMVPKFARDPMKTMRYATEGVKTWRGDSIVEDVNPWELILQASGFTPARVAERYEINNRLKNRERKIMDERKGLHNDATSALREKEPIPQSVMDRIRDYNSRFPEYPITGDTIRRSLRGRIRASERNEFGVSLNPKLNNRLREEVAPTIYN